MKGDLRHSVRKYLEAEGRLRLAKLGPSDEPARPPDPERLASFESSLRQSQRFREHVQWICVGLLCSVFALQAAFLIHGFLTDRVQVGVIGGAGLLLLPTIWRLRRIWIDTILTELILDAIRDQPPEEAIRTAERVHWVLLGIPPKPDPKDKIRILFVTSDPTNATRLRLGKEALEIQKILQADRFDFHQWSSVTHQDLSQALLRTKPEIVHFSGHGTGKGEICFENERGEAFPAPPAALASVFREFRKIRCVLLNTCYSEEQAKAIAEHIEYVVGIQGEIDDQAAIAFSIGFYQALGASRSIEDAYRLGRAAAGFEGLDPGAVVLIRRSP